MSRLNQATALLLDGTLLLDSSRDARRRWRDRVNEWLRVIDLRETCTLSSDSEHSTCPRCSVIRERINAPEMPCSHGITGPCRTCATKGKIRCLDTSVTGGCQRGKGHDGGHCAYDIDDAPGMR